MPVPVTPPPAETPATSGGLVRSRRLITAARSRTATPSDGGSSGVSDSND
ncbi:hypothetical protein OG840_61715 [Streptomyces sp. NBC_01764]|nr:hypothetical protein [Streptomyces sp. NBC_01764]MCX4411611.1 hypothetical protein [Streptomyces sp. NBC_01764]